MKTKLTKETEEFIYNRQVKDKLGVFGCFEVTVGFGGDEIVDFVTYETDGTFRCYEIKTSLADLKSKNKLSFVGHYNYLVMPEELYQNVKGSGLLPFNVGIITPVKMHKKPTRKQLSMGKQVTLLESMVRSLAREQSKYKGLLEQTKHLEDFKKTRKNHDDMKKDIEDLIAKYDWVDNDLIKEVADDLDSLLEKY